MTFKFDYTVILIVKITCWFLHNYLLYHSLSMIYLKRQKCLAQSFITTLITHQMELSTNHHFFWSFFTLNGIICLRLMQKRPSMGEQCSRHLVTPTLVSPRNDVFGTSAKKSKLILVISANQKHYPDLGHVTLHQKEISDVILLETDGGFAKCRLFSEAKKRTQASYLKKIFSSWTFRQLCEKKLLQLICIKKRERKWLRQKCKNIKV